jgi:hypothetical protein
MAQGQDWPSTIPGSGADQDWYGNALGLSNLQYSPMDPSPLEGSMDGNLVVFVLTEVSESLQ